MRTVTLDAFIRGHHHIVKPKIQRNLYVAHRDWKTLYVRYSRRFIEGVWWNRVIDLATIEAKNPGKGAFFRMVRAIRRRYPDLGIYVECVVTARFSEHLKQRGFVCTSPDLDWGSYFLQPAAPLLEIGS